MKTLDVILEEAAPHVSADRITVLGQDQFCHVRAPSSPQFRARLDAALFGSADLTDAERQNVAEGLEVIEPLRGGIHGGTWSLRNIAHRGELYPAGETHYTSLVEALAAAIEWWEAETWCRGVVVRKFYRDKKNAP